MQPAWTAFDGLHIPEGDAMKVAAATVILLITATIRAVGAQGIVVQAPAPDKDQIVKVCTTDFFERNRSCETRQFLEKRGDDLVYMVQKEGESAKGELIVTGHLSTKVRPFSPATYVPHSFFLNFPIAVGASWKGTFDQTSGGQTRNRTRTAEVTGYVDLKLKAGTFKAFRIDAYNHWSEAPRPAVERYHYCPALSMICQYESREFDMKQEVVEVTKASR